MMELVEKKIGDLVEKKIETFNKNSVSQFRYVDISSIDNIKKEIVESRELFSKDAPSRAKYILKKNDVVVSNVRPNLNAVAIVNELHDASIGSSGFTVLRPSDGVATDYLFLNLISPNFLNYVDDLVQGAMYPAISDTDVKRFIIKLPKNKTDQQRIASEIKLKLGKVEQMRQAALKQKEAVEALQGALLREVFPYKEGEELPKGWKWEKIGKICKVQAGGTPSRADMSYWTNGTIPWLKTGEIVFNEINQPEEFITQSGLDNSSAKLVPPQSVLIALYGQGKTRGRVAINNFEVTTNQACAAIIPPKNLSTKYLFYYLWANYETLRDLSSGSNQDNLNADLVKTFSVPVPSDISVQDEIVNIISEKMNSQIKLKQQTETQLEAVEAMPAAILREVFDFNTNKN